MFSVNPKFFSFLYFCVKHIRRITYYGLEVNRESPFFSWLNFIDELFDLTKFSFEFLFSTLFLLNRRPAVFCWSQHIPCCILYYISVDVAQAPNMLEQDSSSDEDIDTDNFQRIWV
jgi:hypothetical protein